MRGHGQSKDGTRFKLMLVERYLDAWTKVVSEIKWMRAKRIVCVDTTAGPGWNVSCNRPGSPILLVRALRQSCLNWTVHLIEKEGKFVDELRANIELNDPRIFIHRANHCGWLKAWNPDRSTVGLVINDPNGPKDCPFEILHGLSEKAPRLDYLIVHNMHAAIRASGVKNPLYGGNGGMRRYDKINNAQGVVSALGKRDAVLSGRVGNGRGTFRAGIFLATNGPAWSWPACGLFPLSSLRGLQNAAQIENRTKDKADGQLFLPL